MLIISNSFTVTKAQKEEGTYSKSQNKTVAELAININVQKHFFCVVCELLIKLTHI